MPRLPLLAGPSIAVVNVPEDGVVLRPRAAQEVVADIAVAVTEALRFPLEGPPLAELVRGASRVTIVVELPSLPIPGAPIDPRQRAVEGTSDELERAGVPSEAQTLLVAGGFARRPGPGETGLLVRPEFRRRFRGRVVVHDVEDPGLEELDTHGATPLRVNRALVETDAVLVVSAAETVLHGGPAALLAAGGPEALRAAGATSLLEPSTSTGWELALVLERSLAARVPVMGVSIVLNHPRLLAATLRNYPYDVDAAERLARSPIRRALLLVPRPLRAHMLRSVRRELTAGSAFAGPPSVAHAEALLRSIAAREAVVPEPLDTLVVGIPPSTVHLPREQPNPLMAANVGLGVALRLWRDAFPIAAGGTAILLHPLHRRFEYPTQQPYRVFFQSTPIARDAEQLRDAERAAAIDPRSLAAYREGRACHPLLPFADWAACGPAVERLGAVLVAGCRDSVVARQLGLVPTHGVGAALEMARGRAGGEHRLGVLLAPPYFPLRTG